MSERNPYSSRLPLDEQRDHLMVQVAKLYYDLERTQSDIATELGLTRWQVGKLLTEAKAEGIVRIEITPRANRKTSLEVALQQAFKLRDAVVVPMGEITDPALLIDSVAQAAATYLANLNPKPDLLGVSWGRTMSAVARALPSGWNPGAHVVLVNGSTTLQQTSTRTSAVAEEFAQSAGGTATLLPVPAIVGKSSTRDALEEDPIIERVLALAEAAPVICYGMGGVSHQSVLMSSGYLTQADIDRLKALGSVGDILGRFVDHQGRIVDPALDARTVGLRLEALRRKDRAIGVVAGEEKHQIAAAALRAGYVSVLVTDEATARNILEETE
ncbi:sugar-binding transcriptional regulator [Gemmobacter fulvus]|uniref:Sugar-binding transcriptional regulator n=1 Tax=Gemmobacter fulvus TaxID=2840474 RepID=A0A975P4X7_9RHOB|nr:sugar-binding transcriptional regulator [Gemmobacter fulvus]MBT9246988.1 sugar-binding transcriptional regulator [Gemmobacter fulvus]MDQ1847407.1 sugar-binding transcriptional regulator [Gemmobacter fulvus]QWK89760.1 sugar-binding transcriptional regulator [Gemmobacter fulvus]